MMSDTATFTINLVFNAFMQLFPTNTMAQFTTLLPQKIELFGGEWDVTLLETHGQPKSKTLQTQPLQSVDLILSQTEQLGHSAINQYQTASIPRLTVSWKSCWTKCTSICVITTSALIRHRRSPYRGKLTRLQRSYRFVSAARDLRTNFCSCSNLTTEAFTLGITEVIRCTMDGGDGNKQASTRMAAQGTYPVDLQGGRHTMVLYCDWIQNEILGDAQRSLLRAVPLDTSARSAVSSKMF